MMNPVKYTFLLPAYKAAYLEQALLSIKNQTYQNYHVIVSDDCSPEPIKEAFDKICLEDGRFHYRRNEHNLGGISLVSHWNLLVELCDTEYLILASDDDVYDENYLSEMDLLVQKYPRTNLFRARIGAIDTDGTCFENEYIYDEFLSPIDFLWILTDSHHHRGVGNYMYRTKNLKLNSGFFDYPAAWYSDYATAIQLSQNGVASSKRVLFFFRHSSLNISSDIQNKKTAKQKINGVICFINWIESYLNSITPPGNKKEKNYLYAFKEYNRKDVYSQACLYSWGLSISDFVRLFVALRKKNYLISLYWKYYFLKCYLKNKTRNVL